MILFKSCPRCGGDIDATYAEDIYCVQCSHRLPTAVPERGEGRGPGGGAAVLGRLDQGPSGEGPVAGGRHRVPRAAPGVTQCPRCDSAEPVRLDRLRERDNYCYRCRQCGHVFSPGAGVGAS